MWIQLEGAEDPEELFADITRVKNLSGFKKILTEQFKELKGAELRDIAILDSDKEKISPGRDLQELSKKVTDEKPLIIRYPLSNSVIIVRLRHIFNKEECIIPHSSGSFNLLQKEAKALFGDLNECETSDIYFEDPKSNNIINSAYYFNILVKKISDGEKRDLGDLKVRIKNRKAYSEWKLDEVLRDIYHYKSGILDAEVKKFDMECLPLSSPPLSDKELDKLVEQLKDKKNVFEKVNVNEATTREFISVILVNAVNHVKENNDVTAKLMVEVNLKGSHGYGPLYYAVLLRQHFIIITEAKPLETEKGIAQNLAQMHSASEMLKKRKIDQTDLETMPIIGVVTTGMAWLFIRYIGPIESAQLEICDEFYCSFMGNMED
ncbi:5315_t:CDS:2, partial [Cetraspora pellucida]